MTFLVHDGRIWRDREPLLVLGVNYHPSVAGCDIWTDWDPDTIGSDFRRMSRAGLNTVRIFLFWRDFQPAADVISEQALQRLDAVLDLAARAGLLCVPSLFTVWMNGQLLDLPWRDERDPWRDEELLAAEEQLCAAVAARLRAHDNVLALDLGDELWNIDPVAARSLTRAGVARWQLRLAGVLRANAPGLLVLQANDASGVFGPLPYGPDNSAGLDLIATHGFPTWAPGSIESSLSYKATNLVSFQVRVAAAYGTVLVDELGSYGVDEATAAAYLRASAASALANGAAGIIAWCWQDIASQRDPYRERPAERRAGLHRLDGAPKPAMATYGEVLAGARDLATSRAPASAAILLPSTARNAAGTYLDGSPGMIGVFYACLLARRAHVDFDVTVAAVTGRRLVIVPSLTRLTITTLALVETAANDGAVVYLSLGDHLHAFPGEAVVGAEIVDFAPPHGKGEIRWDDEVWPVRWDLSSARPTTMRITTAEVLAEFPDGSPALVSHRLGKGRILFCNVAFEQQLDEPGRITDGAAHRFYQRIAELADVPDVYPFAGPDVEVVPGHHGGRRVAVLINHGTVAEKVPDLEEPIEPKGWSVLNLSDPRGG